MTRREVITKAITGQTERVQRPTCWRHMRRLQWAVECQRPDTFYGGEELADLMSKCPLRFLCHGDATGNPPAGNL